MQAKALLDALRAYGWSEPGPLVRKTRAAGSLSGWDVVGSVVSWTVITGILAVAVLRLR